MQRGSRLGWCHFFSAGGCWPATSMACDMSHVEAAGWRPVVPRFDRRQDQDLELVAADTTGLAATSVGPAQRAAGSSWISFRGVLAGCRPPEHSGRELCRTWVLVAGPKSHAPPRMGQAAVRAARICAQTALNPSEAMLLMVWTWLSSCSAVTFVRHLSATAWRWA